MDTAAEDPRTKANAFRIPLFDSQNWQKMSDLGTFTIMDMVKVMADDEGPTPPKNANAKKSRNRMQRCAKSKAIEESDSTDSTVDKPTKSAGGAAVKSYVRWFQFLSRRSSTIIVEVIMYRN